MQVKGWLFTACECGRCARVYAMDGAVVECEHCRGKYVRPGLLRWIWQKLFGGTR